MESITRVFIPPKEKSYFIFGPRGTGKSTWVKQNYPGAVVIDLLEPDTYRQFKSFPERLREVVEASNQTVFIIDEIQKAPSLLSLIHALIEEDKQRRFILTGSSTRKLKREGVDLLAGRARLTYMHTFMATELKEKFSLANALQFGLLPLVYDSTDPAADLKTYLALYMKEEVQMEGLVRNVEEFGQFLEAISFSQGSILNYSNIARDCHVSSKSIESYVSILEDLLLSFKLPVFNKKAKRLLAVKPKFYYFDAGVYRAIRPKGPLDYPEELNGITLETLVAQHLQAWLDYSPQEGKLFFWRTKNGLEVDFIIYGEIGFYAIEVKHAKTIQPRDLRGLSEFKQDYPESKCILLYQGKEALKKKGGLCYPVNKFLLGITPGEDLIS
ncbi:MAG: AAA family ATPase [Coxiellaceae bacterium]|nr:AAA family ATPase [Coxiellaceae bacterium]